MNALQEATQLARAGQFADAARILDAGPIERSGRSESSVLRAELIHRFGDYGLAQTLADGLLKSRDLTAGQQSACHVVLALIDAEHRQFDSAITHLQRAVGLAQKSADYYRACWAQLRLLILVSDNSGPDAAISLIAELRANIARAGDPVVAAALHAFVAQMEAKRSLLSSAHRHLCLARRLLETGPNVWLEAMAEQTEVAIAIMRADVRGGIRHADRAVALSERSGAAYVAAVCRGNLANLLLLAGDYDRAFDLQESCSSTFAPGSDSHVMAIDTLANVRLAQNRLDECSAMLDQIAGMTASPDSRTRYAYRHSLLTRIQLASRRGQFDEALSLSETGVHLAEASGDVLLFHLTTLARANLLTRTSRDREAIEALASIADTVATQPPQVYAFHELALACGLSTQHRSEAARPHLARARRVLETLHHAPGLVELDCAWNAASSGDGPTALDSHDAAARGDEASVARTVQGMAALMVFGDRLDLLARESVEIISQSGCARSVRAVLRRADGPDEILWSTESADADEAEERRLAVGPFGDGEIELIVAVRRDMESMATFNAMKLVLSGIRDLERARIEREERATLWPPEDLPIDGEHAVIGGQMREQMEFARRIARTNVSVLITGESGTGKDILAHAIHEFSARASKPFVAFNCAAIPRDLLESQLFGHRRGAFTGADRDHAGVIRGARGGTLFLDEIGELSPELQPKLLRFLESGEIAPLGEPSLTVDVRIVAATNNNLEDAVRAGRFREDLFYRLNVVRLSLRPLRERRDEVPGLVRHLMVRAAEEFSKGHVRMSEEVLERLILYRWPGNVRQLQNEVRRMVALAEPGSTLTPGAISPEILGALPLLRPTVNGTEIAVSLQDKLLPTLARIEGEMIKAALTQHRGRMDAVAKALGISRKGLYLKRQRLGL